jgi:hypothetical protein
MIDDMAVLLLRAEHYDLRISVNLYIMPGRPVKKIIRVDCFLCAVRVRRRELPAQNEAPVWALAQISIQPLEQRRGINPCRKTEVLATDLA